MIHKLLTLGTVAGIFFAVSAVAYAEGNIPGHAMQQKGSYKSQPGASPYSPGHEMQRKGSRPGDPGASGYAPGHH